MTTKSKPSFELGPDDKYPAPHGYGNYFRHTKPQRHVPTITGQYLCPASADKIAPLDARAIASVEAAFDLLANLLGDRDYMLRAPCSDERMTKSLAEAEACARIKGGILAILREARPYTGRTERGKVVVEAGFAECLESIAYVASVVDPYVVEVDRKLGDVRRVWRVYASAAEYVHNAEAWRAIIETEIGK